MYVDHEKSYPYRNRVLTYKRGKRDKGNKCIVYLAPMEGHCQWAWPVLQSLSVVLLRWLCEDL